jgi:hypothetical protein
MLGTGTPAELLSRLTGVNLPPSQAFSTDPSLLSIPKVPKDLSTTTVRLLLADTRGAMEKFSERVDGMMEKLRETHVSIREASEGYKETAEEKERVVIDVGEWLSPMIEVRSRAAENCIYALGMHGDNAEYVAVVLQASCLDFPLCLSENAN